MIAQQSGYLRCVCESLAEHLETMPGDVRAQVGFVAYNSAVHFYSLAEGFNQPHEITVVDIDDPFLPCPDNLLINLNECKELIKDLLQQLPNRFANSHDSNSALGAALQVAYKLMVCIWKTLLLKKRIFSYIFRVLSFLCNSNKRAVVLPYSRHVCQMLAPERCNHVKIQTSDRPKRSNTWDRPPTTTNGMPSNALANKLPSIYS